MDAGKHIRGSVHKVISTVGVCSPCAPTGSEKDLQGGSDRRRQKSEQDAGECEENRGRQAVCLTGALRAEVFMTAFQRKRRTQSGLEACERKAARLARMDGLASTDPAQFSNLSDLADAV